MVVRNRSIFDRAGQHPRARIGGNIGSGNISRYKGTASTCGFCDASRERLALSVWLKVHCWYVRERVLRKTINSAQTANLISTRSNAARSNAATTFQPRPINDTITKDPSGIIARIGAREQAHLVEKVGMQSKGITTSLMSL